MALDQCFNNQNSLLNISLMVVDDDPIFLQVMSRMLVKSKYQDPSITELTVVAVKDAIEALSALKIQRNKIDLIVTDYYMPGMNGLQLKAEITREFGNLPVIVISSDNSKEQESLSCGAMCFIPKPIKTIDLAKIYELAITFKKNGKSILQLQHNHKVTNIGVPKQIELLPDQQTKVLKTRKTKGLTRSISGLESSQPSKKKKITWTDFLHDRFLQAIRHIGLDKAVPKKILEFMNVLDLTRANVASHLQKYRIFLRKVAEEGLIHSSTLSDRNIDSISNTHFRELYDNYFKHSNSWYDTSRNKRSSYSKPILGFGQSRLLSNPPESFRFNQISYTFMNRSSTYEPSYIGSNLTVPIRSNLNFPIQPSQNEGRISFLEPHVMANRIDQTSQVIGFGDNNSNNNMMNIYGSSTPSQPGLNRTPTLYQPRLSSYGSLTPNQLGMSSYGSSTPSQAGLNGYGSLSPTQSGLRSYGNSTLNQPELGSSGLAAPNQLGPNTSSTPTQSGHMNYGNSTLNQPELSSYGNATPNQIGSSSYETQAVNQPGPSHFGYGMQSFLNNENALSQTNATTQPNVETPQLENLNLYDDFSKTNELACNISNFHFDQDKQQGELPANFATELDQIFSCEEDDDWMFVEINQDHFIEETSNTFAAPETNSTVFNLDPNHNQEQDAADFIDWSSFDILDLVDDDFMDSVFNNDMN